MRQPEVDMAWRVSAFFIGAALPLKIFGPAVMYAWLVLGIVFGCLALGGQTVRLRTWTWPFKRRGFWFVVAVFAAISLTGFFGIDSSHSGRKLVELLLVASGCLFLAGVLRQMPAHHVATCLRVLALSTMVMAVFVFMDGLAVSERVARALNGPRWQSPTRLYDAGAILAVLAPWVWVWLVRRWREGVVHWQMAAWPVCALLALAVFMASGKPGWVGFVVGGLVFLVLAARWHGLVLHRRHWVALPIVVVGVMALGAAIVVFMPHWQSYASAFSFEHWPHFTKAWHFALTHIAQNPFLGVGPSNLRNIADVPFEMNMVGNALLEIGLEMGLVGVAAFVALWAVLLAHLWRYSQFSLPVLGGFVSVVIFLTISQYGVVFLQSWWAAFFGVIALFALRLCQGEKSYA